MPEASQQPRRRVIVLDDPSEEAIDDVTFLEILRQDPGRLGMKSFPDLATIFLTDPFPEMTRRHRDVFGPSLWEVSTYESEPRTPISRTRVCVAPPPVRKNKPGPKVRFDPLEGRVAQLQAERCTVKAIQRMILADPDFRDHKQRDKVQTIIKRLYKRNVRKKQTERPS